MDKYRPYQVSYLQNLIKLPTSNAVVSFIFTSLSSGRYILIENFLVSILVAAINSGRCTLLPELYDILFPCFTIPCATVSWIEEIVVIDLIIDTQ
jgi:hypothetical protein